MRKGVKYILFYIIYNMSADDENQYASPWDDLQTEMYDDQNQEKII